MSSSDSDAAPTATADAAFEQWMQAARAGDVRLLARPDVTATDVDDEMILYNPADGSTHALNLTAALIWELCDGTYTLDAVAAEVASDFNLPIEQARSDAEALIEQFYKLGLLQTADEGTGVAAE